MDMSQWNFHSDEEIAETKPARSQGDGGVYINSLRADTPAVFWFLSKPGEWEGDWINFRELETREGLWMDVELPQDLTYGILVQDDYVVENPLTGKRERRFDNNRDPITAGSPGKQMWRTTAKNVDKAGLVRIKSRCAVNVVDAITGYHKIIKMSPKAKADLVKYFAIKDEDGDFDIQGRPYQVLWTGKDFDWNIAINPVRPGSQIIRDGKAVEVAKVSELPPALDVRQILIEQRQTLDAFLASLPTRSGRPVETGLPDDHFMSDKSMADHSNTDMGGSFDEQAEFPKEPGGLELFAAKEEDKAVVKEALLTEKYLAMSPARLRALLAKANVEVERGAPKEQLAAMAAEHIG